METVIIIIQVFAAVAGCLAALLSVPLFLRLHWPAPALWFIKMYASALSPVLFAAGVLTTIAGLATGSLFISAVGIYDASVFLIHIIRVTRPPDFSGSFKKAFGMHWEERLKPAQKKYFLPSRIALKLPSVPTPRLEQNISFATIPGTNLQLLCDVWQPPSTIPHSGLAFVYMHGSAWCMLDKDLGTRPFFSHLAAQGHVIMDVANRLAPETDMMGMVNDAKRAIIWMKENAGRYGVNPDRIIVSGGSAGAHLALLTAYTAGNPQFTPKESEGKDISVCGVISFYGPADLEAMYYHTNQHLTTRETPGKPKKAAPSEMPKRIIKKMGKEYYRLRMDRIFENAGAFVNLFGGHPDEVPQQYALFSPVTHVHSHCPPTLLIHGEDDLMSPVKSVRLLRTRLAEKNVPAVLHVLPQTDHAFDLQLPKISPSAHNAIYDAERFLALMANDVNLNQKKMTWKQQSQLQPQA